MAIRCEYVHRLELRKFFLKFCVAHLPVKREIRTEFNFAHACSKKEMRELIINGVFGTLPTLPHQPKI